MSEAIIDLPPTPPLRVEPERLEAVGRAWRAVAAELRAQVDRPRHPIHAVRHGTSGWTVVTDAVAAAEGWHRILSDLVAEADRLGKGMVQAAAAYRDVDGRVSDLFTWTVR